MTTTLMVESQYVDVLRALGDVEETVQEAIRTYAVERIGERIAVLQHEILGFQTQYGLPYEKFYVQITTNEGFVKHLRHTHPTWERDFNAWEYYLEELHEWLGRLESISKA
jgi:hypothetical protein